MMDLDQPPPADIEAGWIAEYERIEAEILAASAGCVSTPLLAWMVVERMGYRKPGGRLRLEDVVHEKFVVNKHPAYPDYYPPHCQDPI